MTSLEAILSKVQALMNKTVANGCTQEEAAAAAALAQSILFKHNLSMAQAKGFKKEEAESIRKHTTGVRGAKVSYRWRKQLTNFIANYNWCSVISDEGDAQRIWIIGKSSNVAVVEYLAEVVGDEIHRLAQRAADSRKYYLSFCQGAIAAIVKRLHTQQKENIRAASGSQALVVQSKEELEQAVAQYFPELKEVKNSAVGDLDAFVDGVRAGAKIPMNKGLEKSTK